MPCGWFLPISVSILAAVICVTHGCAVGPRASPQHPAPQPALETAPGSPDNSPAVRPDAQYYVRYDVLRVEVPVGTVSKNETLWNHVDESIIPFAVSRRLRVNGFRLGITDAVVWPAIKAFLDSAGAAQAMQAGLSQTDLLPFAIQVDQLPRDHTVFFIGRDDKLRGSKFADSVLLFRVRHAFDPDSMSEFQLSFVPEVRRANPRTVLSATESGLRETPVYEGKVFGELRADIEASEHSIVVIGPSERAGRKFLIGTQFLCGDRNGIRFERIFFVTPRWVRYEPGALRTQASP